MRSDGGGGSAAEYDGFIADAGESFAKGINGRVQVECGAAERVFADTMQEEAGLFEAGEAVRTVEHYLKLRIGESSGNAAKPADENGGGLASESRQSAEGTVMLGGKLEQDAVPVVEKRCAIEQPVPSAAKIVTDVGVVPSGIEP